ncbi:hypothetical protein EDB87DRAFT_1833906 [Lactarius vividus]|nr:hypothetical protein EDB87DRAFT_1833906 [Lactarius vividus]
MHHYSKYTIFTGTSTGTYHLQPHYDLIMTVANAFVFKLACLPSCLKIWSMRTMQLSRVSTITLQVYPNLTMYKIKHSWK